MATKSRLRRLGQADVDRECKEFKERCGELVVRQMTPEEIEQYQEKKKARERERDRDTNIDRYRSKGQAV